MAEFYAVLATVAANLIKAKGQVVTFSRSTGGTFDPVLGGTTGATTTTFTANAAAFDYANKEIDGTIVQAGDVRLIAETTATVPAVDDICTVNSIVYRVMNVSPVSPAGITVINKVQLRK